MRRSATPRTKPPEERRRDLLAAGERVFLARGIESATLDEITREAGMSKGAFYLHFRSKDDLVSALQKRYAERFVAAVAATVDPIDDWDAKVDAYVEAAYNEFHVDVELHDVLFRHSETGRHDPQRLDDLAPIAWLRDFLRAGNAAGVYDVADPATTAAILFVAVHGYDRQFHADPGPTREQLVGAMKDLFRRTLGMS